MSHAHEGSRSRVTRLLDGHWEVAEGALACPPERFDHTVPVPGLLDLASPAFPDVGVRSERREAFWYRTRLTLDGPVPDVAVLRIAKAAYGVRVLVNGEDVGSRDYSFTAARFDVRDALRPGENELLVRVGAWRDAVPRNVPTGADHEKEHYLPGIYDSVTLTTSSTPHVVDVEPVPDVEAGQLVLVAQLENHGDAATIDVTATVREHDSGVEAGRAQQRGLHLAPGGTEEVELTVPLPDCRLWSPEDPFLYDATVSVGTDEVTVRTGMRRFVFDPERGHAILNGQPYYLRGTNVCAYRFFEDPAREQHPWDDDWVRRLVRTFRSLHWNAARFSIGFPPERWYEIADEEGLLIQDEYPLWYPSVPAVSEAVREDREGMDDMEGLWSDEPTETLWPPELTTDDLATEFAAWVRERRHHPSVVIFDTQNETYSERTGEASARVRHLDRQQRPWDNGWGPQRELSDVFETHFYPFAPLFFGGADSLEAFAGLLRTPQGFDLSEVGSDELRELAQRGAPIANATPNREQSPIIVNEYGWLWLSRDGYPTPATKPVYDKVLGREATPEEYREVRARLLGAETEFLRHNRTCAGVLHFAGLTFANPEGVTGDEFTDIPTLALEPHAQRRLRDAFAPVGVMLDEWHQHWPAGHLREVAVVLVNDLADDWDGPLDVALTVRGEVAARRRQRVRVPAWGQHRVFVVLALPNEPGEAVLTADISGADGEPVQSVRHVRLVPDPPPQGAA